MGRKLSGMGSGIVVNVKAKAGETFIGKLLTGRKELKKGNVTHSIYEFSALETDMTTQKKEGDKYVDVDIKEGDRVSIFAPSVLNRALEQAEVGETIKIVYKGLGDKKRGMNAPHLFEVEVI